MYKEVLKTLKYPAMSGGTLITTLSLADCNSPEIEDNQTVGILVFGPGARKADTVYYIPSVRKHNSYIYDNKILLNFRIANNL
jgi:hypothetical protein